MLISTFTGEWANTSFAGLCVCVCVFSCYQLIICAKPEKIWQSRVTVGV